jgi:hypothetical protein
MGTTLMANITLATYKIDGLAFVPSSGGLADCSPSEKATAPFTLAAGGSTVAVDTLAFLACQ